MEENDMTTSDNNTKTARKDSQRPDVMILDMHNAKFPLGRLVCTPGALEEVKNDELATALNRHLAGDWGEVCKEDRAENEFSLENGLRLISIYSTETGVKFWLITEADRSTTTVLLPEEY